MLVQAKGYLIRSDWLENELPTEVMFKRDYYLTFENHLNFVFQQATSSIQSLLVSVQT